jgi:hypothetical protein
VAPGAYGAKKGEIIMEKIDLKRISGIQYDLKDQKLTSRVIDEIDYIRGLIAFLDHTQGHPWKIETSEAGEFGKTLIFGWVENRLEGLRDHIQGILKKGKPGPLQEAGTVV